MSFFRNAKMVLVFLCTLLLQILSGAYDTKTFTIINECRQMVRPVIVGGIAMFCLQTRESTSIRVPNNWSGFLWGTNSILCLEDNGKSKGDYDQVPVPATTVASFKLNSSDEDEYGVSLLHGFNLPMAVIPTQGDCNSAGCFKDLNTVCPLELRVINQGHVVGCQNKPPYVHSNFFETQCPTSNFTCASDNYSVIFCPKDPSTGYNLDEDNNSRKKTNPTKFSMFVFAVVFLSALFMICFLAYLLLSKNPNLLNHIKPCCEQCNVCNVVTNLSASS